VLYRRRVWTDGRMRKSTFVFAQGLAAAVLIFLGFLTWKQTQIWHDTETLWRHAFTVDPASIFARRRLADELYEQRKGKEAVEVYRQAVEASPASLEAHLDLGRASIVRGELDEAIEHYRQAVRLNPGSAIAHGFLGQALKKKGESEEAAQHFERALQIDPDFAEAMQ
jgi:tetratricopeptide (TPR) repeat protein